MHWRRRQALIPLSVALAAATATTPAAAQAQASAQAPAQALKTDGFWRGTGGASFSAVSGNSRSTTVGLDTSLQRATERDRWSLDARARYARGDRDGVRSTTSNQWAAGGQYDLNLGPRNYLFGKLALESDAVVSLALRHTVSAGAGHAWLDGPRHRASVFAGLARTVDRYDTLQTVAGIDGRRFTRNSLLLGQESSHAISPSTTLKQRLEVFDGRSGDRARRTQFTASLAVAMNARFSVTLGLSHASNSRPPAGARRDDLGLLAGLSLKFGPD